MRALFLFLVLLFVSSAHARDSSKISCRFLCLEGAAPPPPLVNVAPDGTEVPCKVSANTLSPPVVCSVTDGTVSFLSADDRKPAASARVPADLKTAILVFVAAPKDDDALPWRVFVVDDSPGNFPDGGAFVANFHNQDVRLAIGENDAVLPPAGYRGVARPDKRDDFNMAPVVFKFQRKDAWITVSESMLRFVPGVRYLIFAYVDPTSARPRVSTYQDFRPPAVP